MYLNRLNKATKFVYHEFHPPASALKRACVCARVTSNGRLVVERVKTVVVNYSSRWNQLTGTPWNALDLIYSRKSRRANLVATKHERECNRANARARVPPFSTSGNILSLSRKSLFVNLETSSFQSPARRELRLTLESQKKLIQTFFALTYSMLIICLQVDHLIKNDNNNNNRYMGPIDQPTNILG